MFILRDINIVEITNCFTYIYTRHIFVVNIYMCNVDAANYVNSTLQKYEEKKYFQTEVTRNRRILDRHCARYF